MKNQEIIDNSEGKKLVDFLKEKLEENQREFDVATAFFNTKAFSMLKEELDGVERFRLLLGKSPELNNDRTLGEEIRDRLEKDVEGLDFSRENHESVEELIEFLGRDNVEVRLYDESFLHGKAYIWDDEVVIGSSNLTAAGLTSNNELNSVGQPSKAQYTKREWFEKFWENAKEFNEELIELLKNSRFGTKEYEPYDIFLKTLYEYQKEDLKQELESDERKGRSEVDLTEFQEDAVNRVFTRMKKYGGCLVADSVGLGKTYVAKRVIEEFGFMRRKNFLVVSPASLEDMWRDELKDVGVSENLVTQESIARDNYLDHCKRATGGGLEDVELIVVDESHNLRNPESNTWENLFTVINEHINSDGKKPYVLFLTATPINNSVWDLYWQLMLMLQMDRRAFLTEGVADLYTKFQEVEDKGDPSLLSDLLNEISVRRTREYIQENYPGTTYTDDEGNEIELKFPERKLNDLRYNLDEAYQGYFDKISDMIENDLTMAYYRLLEYKKSSELTQEEEMELGRMKGLQGIFQKILLKRLESSVGAFRESIENHLEFLNKLKEHVERGEILKKETFRDYLMQEEEDIQKEEFEEELEAFDKENYRYDEFIEDLDKDIEVFNKMKELIDEIGFQEDAKLQKLESELKRLSEDEKVVVFAYYSDTIEYIYNYLKDSEELSDKRIEYLTGDSSSKERRRKIKDYKSNNEDSIDIILSTDVLSEGQNLQAAKHLLNYDLHWNPTRMIQRAGRIDRIGTPHDTIFVHNFFPSDELENLLELVKILEGKISDIDESIGLDQKVLDENINPKVFGSVPDVDQESIKRLEENDESIFDEMQKNQFGGGEDFWQPMKEYMRDNAVDKLEDIPYGVFSGHKDDIRGIFFYYKYGDDFHYWYLYDLNNEKIIENKTEILNFISVDKEKDREIPDFFEDVYELSATVREKIEKEYKETEQISKEDRFREWNSDMATKFIPKMIRHLELRLEEHLRESPKDKETEDNVQSTISKLRSVTLTKKRINTIRSFWQDYKGDTGHQDWKKLNDELNDFLKGLSERDRKQIEEFDEDKLRLVTVEFIS